MAIELNDFVEKVLRDLAGFVPVGAKVWFEVSPTYLPPLGFDDSHAIIERTTNPNGDKVTFCVKQCFDKATQQEYKSEHERYFLLTFLRSLKLQDLD